MARTQILQTTDNDDTAKAATRDAASSESAPVSPKRRRGGRWLILLILIAGLGWFAPQIVASTELRQHIARVLFPQFRGTVSIAKARLDWLSPVQLQGLRVRNAEGEVIAEITEVTSERPLWQIATASSRPGRWVIDEPDLLVTLTAEGWNWDSVVQDFSGPSSGGRIEDLQLVIEHGRIEVDDVVTGQKSAVEPWELALNLPGERGSLLNGDLLIGAAGPDQHQVLYTVSPEGNGTAEVRVQDVPLAVVASLAERFLPELKLQGTGAAKGKLRWNAADSAWDWQGAIHGRDVMVSGLDVLSGDRPQLSQLQIEGGIGRSSMGWTLRQLQLTSDVADVDVVGDMLLPDWQPKMSLSQWLHRLASSQHQVEGELRMAPLAKQFPRSLTLRQDSSIQTGRLTFSVTSANAEAPAKPASLSTTKSGSDQPEVAADTPQGTDGWNARLRLEDLGGVQQGRSVQLTQAIDAKIQLSPVGDRWQIDDLQLVAPFLKARGQGDTEKFQLKGRADLRSLTEQLKQFVEIRTSDLSGEAAWDTTLTQVERGQWHVEGVARIANLAGTTAAGTPWNEPELRLAMNSVIDPAADAVLDQWVAGQLQIVSGADRLTVARGDEDSTREGEATAADSTRSRASHDPNSFSITLIGGLDRWQRRLQPVVAMSGWQLAGDVSGSGWGRVNGQRYEIEEFTGEVTNLQAVSADCRIAEPRVQWEAHGVVDLGQQSANLTTIQVLADSFKVQGKDCEFVWTAAAAQQTVSLTAGTNASHLRASTATIGGWQSGRVDLTADLSRLSSWFPTWTTQAGLLPGGLLRASAEVGGADSGSAREGVAVAANGRIENLALDSITMSQQGPVSERVWNEPELKFAVGGRLSERSESLTLDQAQVTFAGLSADATGTVSDWSTTGLIDLQGQVSYDWDQLSQRLAGGWQQSVQLAGRGTEPFAYQGPLSGAVAGSRGRLGVGWDAAQVAGLSVGPGVLGARWDGSEMQVEPIRWSVNDGRLSLTPTVQLLPEGALVQLPQEPVLENLTLSPELCRGWMKYVTPLLADATVVQGRLSAESLGGQFPLFHPEQGDVSGVVQIHQAQAKPGPLVEQLVLSIEQLQQVLRVNPKNGVGLDRSWVELPEQQVSVRLARGRVYHRGLMLQIGEVMVTTEGSVGLDDSLAIVAAIPIQDDWVKDKRIFASLQGQAVRVPIGGTLSYPRIDGRGVAQLAQQLGTNAIESAIEDKVGNSVRKLFDRLK